MRGSIRNVSSSSDHDAGNGAGEGEGGVNVGDMFVPSDPDFSGVGGRPSMYCPLQVKYLPKDEM